MVEKVLRNLILKQNQSADMKSLWGFSGWYYNDLDIITEGKTLVSEMPFKQIIRRFYLIQ